MLCGVYGAHQRIHSFVEKLVLHSEGYRYIDPSSHLIKLVVKILGMEIELKNYSENDRVFFLDSLEKIPSTKRQDIHTYLKI